MRRASSGSEGGYFMLLILLSFQSADLFERANYFIVRREADSAAHYLSKIYREYPTEAENIIYISYLEDSLFGADLAMRLFPEFPRSEIISKIAIYELIKRRNYDEIVRVYEKADSLILPQFEPFMRFYYLMKNGNLVDAISLADSVSMLYEFSWVFGEDLFVKLIKAFIKDVAYHACSNFVIDACYKYISTTFPPDDDRFYVENYSYIAIYGILGPINNLNTFPQILDRLRSYGYLLRTNGCRDGNMTLRVFANLKYINGSYAEADSVLEIIRWLSGFCGDSLKHPLRVSRVLTLPHLDMNGHALDSLRALGDTFLDYKLPILIDYGDWKSVKRIADSIVKSYSNYLSAVSPFLDLLDQIECQELYSRDKYRKVIEECFEDVEKAYAYIMLGKRDSGLTLLKEFEPDTFRDNYAYYWNKGWFSLLYGHLDSAMYYTKRALQYRPENPFLTMNVGSIYLVRGVMDSAMYYYRLSFERNRKRRTYSWDYFFDTWRNDVKLLSGLYDRDSKEVYRLMRRLKKRTGR